MFNTSLFVTVVLVSGLFSELPKDATRLSVEEVGQMLKAPLLHWRLLGFTASRIGNGGMLRTAHSGGSGLMQIIPVPACGGLRATNLARSTILRSPGRDATGPATL